VRPRLERRYEILAPTLPGHFGGPPLPAEVTATTMVEAVEGLMDEAGFNTAHVVGNSLGGHVALQLAARGRARSVVALAPAGGWLDASKQITLDWFKDTHRLLQQVGRHAAFIASTPEGRRQATAALVERSEHLSAETVLHIVTAATNCPEAPRMLEAGEREDWAVGPITCPVRIVWGTEDKLLPWPRAAARYRRDLPYAEWVVLDGVGHCPQLEVPLETAELIQGFA
jgi:pimeloyl-ACP methyl ester carboxylesterase